MVTNVITNTSHLGERLEGGQYSADYIDGLGGDDTIIGHDGADFLVGNTGNDKIFAGADDSDLDFVSGGDGDDELYGGGGGDLLDGGAGDDYMGGGTGNDLMFGDSGVRSFDSYSIEWTHYQATGSWLNLFDDVDLFNDDDDATTPFHQFGVDDNFLNSFKQSESGDDIMWGGTGRDMMFGGWGDDIVGGGYGADLVVGNRGDDVLYAGKGNDVALGGDEDDLIFGAAGDDIIDGDKYPAGLAENAYDDDGDYNLDYGNNYLGDTNWVSNDRVQGGNDVLFGGAGDDWMHGRQGADMLWGGAGDDWMAAGYDNDVDVFGFVGGHGDDTIKQFNTLENPEGGADDWADGEDIIYLEGANYEGEFIDALDDGAIVKNLDDNTVTIDTGDFGLGGTITINFMDDDGAAKFGADNIILNDDDWVDITQSYQFTEGYSESATGILGL